MTSIWAALPVEAVAGFVFSLYWPSSAKIFDEMAPEGTKNIVQGLGAFNFAAGKSVIFMRRLMMKCAPFLAKMLSVRVFGLRL